MKRNLGFTLIEFVLVIILISFAYAMTAKYYKSYQVKKSVLLITESVRTLADVINDQNQSSLLWTVNPESVSLDKSLPIGLKLTPSTNRFTDALGIQYTISILTSASRIGLTNITDNRQGFFVNLNIPARNDSYSSLCTQTILALMNDFKAIKVGANIIKNNNVYSGIGTACAPISGRRNGIYFINF